MPRRQSVRVLLVWTIATLLLVAVWVGYELKVDRFTHLLLQTKFEQPSQEATATALGLPGYMRLREAELPPYAVLRETEYAALLLHRRWSILASITIFLLSAITTGFILLIGNRAAESEDHRTPASQG